jgi:flagellar basal body-associated protein FliL
VLRIALVVVAVLALVAGLAALNVRETARSTYVAGGLGGCGSVIQGSTYDDGGASPDECRKKRHHSTVIALELFLVTVAAGGAGVGLVVYKARSRRREASS